MGSDTERPDSVWTPPFFTYVHSMGSNRDRVKRNEASYSVILPHFQGRSGLFTPMTPVLEVVSAGTTAERRPWMPSPGAGAKS